MTLEISITPDERSLTEIRALTRGDLEEHLASLLTCSVQLTSAGQSLAEEIPKGMRHSRKLDIQGFHGILCLEFLSNLLGAVRTLLQGSAEEEIDLAASLYSLLLERSDDLIRITLDDGEFRSHSFGQFSFAEFKLAVVLAGKSTIEALAKANPNTKHISQVSQIMDIISGLAT